MITNAEKIAAWQKAHPGERLTSRTICEVLDCADLRYADLPGADLRYADLRGADLRYADLRYADLRYAYLRYADLRYADLRGANLRYANLRGADLRYADLRGANLRGADHWGGLRVDGLTSGQVTLVPTPDGWALRVGCWTGTVDDLRTLIATDEGWPEARGEECARRRPQLAALIAMCEAHMTMHADLIPALVQRWGTSKEN